MSANPEQLTLEPVVLEEISKAPALPLLLSQALNLIVEDISSKVMHRTKALMRDEAVKQVNCAIGNSRLPAGGGQYEDLEERISSLEYDQMNSSTVADIVRDEVSDYISYNGQEIADACRSYLDMSDEIESAVDDAVDAADIRGTAEDAAEEAFAEVKESIKTLANSIEFVGKRRTENTENIAKLCEALSILGEVTRSLQVTRE